LLDTLWQDCRHAVRALRNNRVVFEDDLAAHGSQQAALFLQGLFGEPAKMR
jgi:hypothetical protein